MKKIEIMESIFKKNDDEACKLNESFTKSGIFAVNVLGSPGAGKTSSLIKLIPLLKSTAWVIEGDIESDIDTKKLTALEIETVQINTGGACHLDAPMIGSAAEKLAIENSKGGFLFIENIGNLVCPAEFLIGEHIKLLISSLTEGDDKPYKYPLVFEKADVILVNKSDLSCCVDFDNDFFEQGIRKVNKNVPIFYVSGKTGDGFDKVAELLKRWRVSEK